VSTHLCRAVLPVRPTGACNLSSQTEPTIFAIAANLAAGLSLIALTLSVYNIASRLWFPQGLFDAAEEFQVYLVVWAVFLSLASVSFKDQQIKADFLIDHMPQTMKFLVHVITCLLGMIFSAAMTYYGIQVTYQSWIYNDVSISIMRTPMWIYFAALPVGSALLFLAYLLRIRTIS